MSIASSSVSDSEGKPESQAPSVQITEKRVEPCAAAAASSASSESSGNMPGVAACVVATTDFESGAVPIAKISKEVSFCGFVKVVLIPCIADYREANLCDILWWTASDMRGFHNETVHSLRKYMSENQVNDRKRALRMLLEDEAVLAASACKV